MDIAIHYATTDAEREAIYRLRYETYVEEMHIFGSVADHENRWLSGPLDSTARLMYATVDGELAGTLRLHLDGDAPFSQEHKDTYNLDRFPSDLRLMVLTRFMIKPTYRKSLLGYHMIQAVARLSVEEGIDLACIDCQPHLIHYYQRMGFRSYDCPIYNDPEFGIMIPLVFVTCDLPYLRRARSPLADILEGQEQDPERLTRSLAAIGAPAVTDCSCGHCASEALLGELTSRVALFQGLRSDEVKDIVARGHLLRLAEGDRLIRKSQLTQTVFMLLSGTLEVRDGSRVIGRRIPGEVVGEDAFLTGTRRTADVYAGPAGARVISLEETQLRRKLSTDSPAAVRLLANLWRSLNGERTKRPTSPWRIDHAVYPAWQ